ncbi:MAG: hypothetical protein AB7U63_15840, partial [Porticoccaceae bacterium]
FSFAGDLRGGDFSGTPHRQFSHPGVGRVTLCVLRHRSGLVISTFTRSQIAALFGTAILTLVPAVQFSGMIDPVSSLEGIGRMVGEIYPATHFLTISRGVFSKGLSFADLHGSLLALAVAAPLLLAAGTLLLSKQER